MKRLEKFREGMYRGSLPEIPHDLIHYKTVINLETQTQELIFNKDCNQELIWCITLGVTFFDFALSGIFPPKYGDVQCIIFRMILCAKPVLVHCRAGRERTGFVVGLTRVVKDKWTPEKAYAEWIEKGCRWPTRWFWKKTFFQYAYRLQGVML